jgi:hypothetical protein
MLCVNILYVEEFLIKHNFKFNLIFMQCNMPDNFLRTSSYITHHEMHHVISGMKQVDRQAYTHHHTFNYTLYAKNA